MDALVKEDMNACDEVYSEITVKKVKAFKMARYVMLTPNPEGFETSCPGMEFAVQNEAEEGYLILL